MDCGDSQACHVVMNYAIPTLGSIFALCIFLSPFKAIRAVEREGRLGNLNPVPFPMIANNCLVWILYGFLKKDYFIVAPNFFGICLGYYYTLVGFKVGDASTCRKMIILSTGGMFLIFLGGIISFIGLASEPKTAGTVMGSWCIAVLVMFYSSPLTTLYQVITERNSIYFHWPLSVSSLLNAVLWMAYGIAINDMFVAAPNGVGAVFCLIQIGCVIGFPKKEPIDDGREWDLKI